MIELHSCSYFCEKPACIKAQRDEMRDALFDQHTVAALQQKLAASERECEKHKNAVAVYNQDCIAAEKKIAELERGEYICKKCSLRKDGETSPAEF